MKKIWEINHQQNKVVAAYCFGDSEALDNKLITFDVLGSMAHVKMLAKIGIITTAESSHLAKTLGEILALEQQGKFKVEPGDEDVHTKVEHYLTTQLGDLGGKIHTGRSRNDQVLVDLKLYSKSNTLIIAQLVLDLAKKLLKFAQKYEFTPMPGYTHMQKAMPSSVGMWADSFSESLLDDLEILKTAFEINDQNPLGSGAAYGVSLPIDRDFTSKLLGFSKTQNNSLYCQTSRSKGQLAITNALAQIMLTLSRLAEDLLLFTMSEFNFFQLTPELCTGSSIMPQKKNLDVMEIIRAKSHAVMGYHQMIASITSGLPSGYNADFGETKAPFIKAVETTSQTLQVTSIALDLISPNTEILIKACTPELFATHSAYLLVKKGTPFRKAHKQIGLSLDKVINFDPVKILKSSNHVGGPGNLGLAQVKEETAKKKMWWDGKQTYFEQAINNLQQEQKYAN